MKKSKKPEIGIRNGLWADTKLPCFGIGYRLNVSGCGWCVNTLKEAFDALEELAKRDGFTLEQCSWSKWSNYTLKDRPDGVICDRKGQMLFNF